MLNFHLKILKQVLLCSLCVMILSLSFTGCKKETPSDGSKQETNNVNKPYKDTKIDLGGRTVTILPLGNGKKYPDPDSGTYENDMKRVKYVEDKYNCKLVFNTAHSYPEINDYIVTNVLSGLDFADATWSLPWQTVDPYITKEIAVPLNTYLDFNNDNLKKMKLNKWGSFLGNQYIFTTSASGVNCAMLYNKDIFERDNLEDPFELQQIGEWTWDKFLEIAQKATKISSDGTVTQWGVVTTSGADFLMQLYASNNAYPLKRENDQFVVNFSDPKVNKVFELLNKIVVQKKCGLLTELVLDAPVRGDRDWKQGKAAMAFTSLTVAKQYAPENCGFIICPKGPDATDYKSPAHCGPAFMVPATAKNPEASARILYDYYARWDTSIPGGMDDEEQAKFWSNSGNTDLAFGKNDFETFKLLTEKQDVEVMNVVRFNDINNYLVNCIYSPNVYKNVPLATSIEQWTPVANDTIKQANESLTKLKEKLGK